MHTFLALTLIQIAGATLEVKLPKGAFELPEAALLQWIERSAKATAGYFGRFPVKNARIEVDPQDGRGIHGTTYRNHEIDVPLGRAVTAADLADDWVMTHEMVHLGFPSLARRHHWMEEGLATYVEPLARRLGPEKIWGGLVEGLPNGLPEIGDRGLDFTPTWGRTYWGGALFWLLADVQIHERTHNQKGLPQALRAIVAAGGTIEADWPIERVIAVGDRATGVPVLRELYDRMKASPERVDLPALWKRLGVSVRDGRVQFDDHAPLAAVRGAITNGL